MKTGPFKRKPPRQDNESISPLKVTTTAGETIVDLSPETVSIYRRWYTYLSREQPLPRRLGLVSAVRGEGVTTVALALAAVMAADLETRIALVECNWWWPGLAAAAHLEAVPGIAEWVLGQAGSEVALRPCSLPNLTFLPAGQMPEGERSRTARGAALAETLQILNQQFDILILDIPAVLAVKDSPVLAGLADALCLVIRQGVTPLPVVKRGLDEIEHLRVRGVILNGARVHVPSALAPFEPAHAGARSG